MNSSIPWIQYLFIFLFASYVIRIAYLWSIIFLFDLNEDQGQGLTYSYSSFARINIPSLSEDQILQAQESINDNPHSPNPLILSSPTYSLYDYYLTHTHTQSNNEINRKNDNNNNNNNKLPSNSRSEPSKLNPLHDDKYTSSNNNNNNILSLPPFPSLNKNEKLFSVVDDVHIFYHTYWGNPEFDGLWIHWNCTILAGPDEKENAKWKHIGEQYQPPNDIGSVYFPFYGAYSTAEEQLIRQHLTFIQQMGVHVLVVDWYGSNRADDVSLDRITLDSTRLFLNTRNAKIILPLLMSLCPEYNIQLAAFLPPYKGRTIVSIRQDIIDWLQITAKSSSLYRDKNKKDKPWFYFLDSQDISVEDWQRLLKIGGDLSLRDSPYDSIFIHHYLDEKSQTFALDASFDGIHTWYTNTKRTYGSNSAHWVAIRQWAEEFGMLFVATVGPGYNDIRVRPFNSAGTKPRDRGKYFAKHFRRAIVAKPSIIAINSFNGWHEGTNVEPTALARQSPKGYRYLDPGDSFMYIGLATTLIEEKRKPDQDVNEKPMDDAPIDLRIQAQKASNDKNNEID